MPVATIEHRLMSSATSYRTTAEPNKQLDGLLAQSAALHHHLCPRQVLGVRMGLLAGELLQLELPQTRKRLLTLAETDGCFCDGLSVATNCWVGRRTLRVVDHGKAAATFVDTESGAAWRIAPHPLARVQAQRLAPEARNRWEQMLLGYQRLPDAELLVWQAVELVTPVAELLSRPGARALCSACGEEIMNEREQLVEGRVLCRACAGAPYVRAL